MKNFSSHKFVLIKKQSIVEQALQVEDSWDIDRLCEILSPIWSNFDNDPEFEGFPISERNQLFRISGSLLIKLGRAKNLINYIERGKDLLTMASRLFEESGDIHRAIEAEVILAYAYFLEGNKKEFEIILDSAESKFEGDSKNNIYLLIQVNRLISYNDAEEFKKSLELISAIKQNVEECTSFKIKAQFYIESGITFQHFKQHKKSLNSFKSALNCADEINNLRIKGVILNNLSFLYKDMKFFDLALESSNSSIEIYRELKDFSGIPHSVDTNAQIYFDKGDFPMALVLIDESITLFSKGTDYAGLLDALWFKTKILFSLNRNNAAKETYQKLRSIALKNLDEFTVKRYEKNLFTEFKDKLFNTQKISHDVEPLKVIPYERIQTDNLKIQNKDNLLFYSFSKSAAARYLYRKEKTILIIEFKSKIKRSDILIFKTDKGIEVGELLFDEQKNQWFIENSKTMKKYKFMYVDHIGKIIGLCPAFYFNKPKIVFTAIEDIIMQLDFSNLK